MTDDFEKVDEDFASEFDFVDTQPGGPGAGATAARPDTQPMGGAPKGGGPAIVPLIVLIVILGGGYYGYTHFFGSKSAAPPAPEAPKPAASANEIPTLPDQVSAVEAMTQPSKEQAARHAAEALANKPPHNEISAALPTPPVHPTHESEKTFEQMQNELHGTQAQQTQPQTAVPPEVRIALQHISDEMTVNVNNMRQLEGTISNIAITLDHLNKTISAMDNRVLSLTETVDGLSQDLTNVKRVMVDQDLDLTMPGNVKVSSSSSRRQMQTLSNSDQNYSVHAIIPGRAWLKSTSGQIITVTEGDKVGDYGTVAVIDAANGLVRTSSGIIIR